MPMGSCCCKTIRFEVRGDPAMMATCHCSRCRKVGASTFVFVKREDFTLLQGGDAIATYEPERSYKYARNFCRKCGTALGEMLGSTESFPIPANCFDEDLGLSVRFHEFVAEKPSWSVIGDDAKQFAAHPVEG